MVPTDPNGGVKVVGLGTNHRLSLAQNPVLLAGQIAILLASCNRDVARLRKRRQVAALVGLEVAQRPHGVHYTIISRNPTTRTPPLGCRVERDAPRRVRPPPHRTVRAVFPHTALRVGLVSSVSLPFAPRLRFTLIPMDAPPYGRAVSDAPPHSGLSPIAVFRHYYSRHLICIVPFSRRGPSHPRALPRFPATMTSSDSSLRFRYCEASQVPD